MNSAAAATIATIESFLNDRGSFRKIDDNFYVIKQGSSYVMINVIASDGKALVRCSAQLVKGVTMNGELAIDLLTLNSQLRFGAFGYDPLGELIVFQHSILGGETLDTDEILATLTDVALIADEFDDKIIDKYGGQTMKDLLEEAALSRIVNAKPDEFKFGGAS